MDTSRRPIVVIDDEPNALRAMSYLLSREGYEVETAPNGEIGLERVRALKPQIVLLDIMMPVMDGYEVCRHIREDPDIKGTYVIMLSAKGQAMDKEQGLIEGADEYLTKPFSLREVADHIAELFARFDGAIPPSV